MAYLVVEFEKASGGGLAIVRENWMTPLKKECFWPPFKQSANYNKCLTNKDQQPVEDQWTLYPVVKVFYATDCILKARKKLKEAESESEIVTEVEDDSAGKQPRKRKLSRKLIFSDDSSEEDYREPPSPNKIKYLPKPPEINPVSSLSGLPTKIKYSSKPKYQPKPLKDKPECSKSSNYKILGLSNGPANEPTSTDSTHFSTDDYSLFEHPSSEAQTYEVISPTVTSAISTPLPCQPQNATALLHTSQSRTAFNDCIASPISRSSPEVPAIARILSRIERRVDEIQQTQKEILEKLNPSAKLPSIDLPDFIKLPCKSPEEVNILEDWLSTEENANLLATKLSIIGGKKAPNVVRKILQAIFTNNVAALYNWTGKNNKKPLKDLSISKLIPVIVRKNRNTVNTTNDEIFTVIANWFRFTKDRDGGRNARRQ